MENVCGYRIKVNHQYDDFLAELGTADLVLTPTRRLASRLNKDYAKWQASNNHAVWQIDIISLNGWLERLWQAQQDDIHAIHVLRLNTWQTLTVWQGITDNNEQLAKLALEAWTILKEWDLDFESIDSEYVSADIQTFLKWCQAFQTYCKQKNCCDTASMLQLLKPNTQNLNKIYLIGFTDIKPAILKLFKLLQNTEIIVLEYRVPNAEIFRAAQKDSKGELEQAALWARDLLLKNPNDQIGVIIPDLSTRFNEVDDIFSRILMPQTLLANHYHDIKPYNISSGNKLADFPIIAIIFELFKKQHITISPFLNIDAVIDLNQNQYLPPSEWSEIIKTQLHLCGFPGPRVLNSLEYQVVKRFYELLSDYATLDYVQKPLTFSSAIHQIQQQASSVIFQGESENATLQILGALEGEGLYFQHLWVAGLHQENWPQASMPHPFLPIELQRQHFMPHASQEREYQFTSHLTKRFTEQAHHVILSYPQMADDKTLQPSHLIRAYNESPSLQAAASVIASAAKQSRFRAGLLCCAPNDEEKLILETWQEVNVPLKNKDNILGGVGLLQSQSVCPFQAFARYRLKVDVPEPAENGLTFAQRGELTHSALEYFWKTVKKSVTLHQLNHHELEDIIEKSVHHALKQFTIQPLSQKHLEIEHSRLKQLINDWIVLEKQRPEFNVLHTEKNINIQLSDLKLRARIDRIDELTTGEIILIDYKTGQIPAADWLDPRPSQVQLPVYAISYPQATHIAIAKVKANEHQFKQIDGFELSWEDMLNHWQQTLTHLADEFIAGHNEVSPIEGEHTCQYCGLELLCRIRSA